MEVVKRWRTTEQASGMRGGRRRPRQWRGARAAFRRRRIRDRADGATHGAYAPSSPANCRAPSLTPAMSTEAASVEAAFAATRADLGDVDALIYNAGSGVWGHVEEVKAEDLERSWRVNTLGLFLTGQQVIPAMRRKGQGAIIVVGATASRRGAAGAAAFAQSKMAQRALAESMARHLWPAGIHVALIVVDGVVGGPVTRSRFGDRPDDFLHRSGRRRRDRRRPRQTGSLRLEFRGRSAAVQGEVVSHCRVRRRPASRGAQRRGDQARGSTFPWITRPRSRLRAETKHREQLSRVAPKLVHPPAGSLRRMGEAGDVELAASLGVDGFAFREREAAASHRNRPEASGSRCASRLRTRARSIGPRGRTRRAQNRRRVRD